MDNAVPVNVHIIVFKNKCVVLPASIQLIEHRGGQFSYIGADFHAFLTSEQRDKIQTAASMLGEKMRTIGYRGICGIDFMVSNKGVYFLEINARFQSSTFLTNKLWLNAITIFLDLMCLKFENSKFRLHNRKFSKLTFSRTASAKFPGFVFTNVQLWN